MFTVTCMGLTGDPTLPAVSTGGCLCATKAIFRWARASGIKPPMYIGGDRGSESKNILSHASHFGGWSLGGVVYAVCREHLRSLAWRNQQGLSAGGETVTTNCGFRDLLRLLNPPSLPPMSPKPTNPSAPRPTFC